MKQILILLQYVLLLLNTICRVVEYCFRVANPEQGFFTISNAEIFYSRTLSSLMMTLFELTLVLTMHKLTLSLKLLLGETS